MPAMTDINTDTVKRENCDLTEDSRHDDKHTWGPSTSTDYSDNAHCEGFLPPDFNLGFDPISDYPGTGETAHYPSPLSGTVPDESPLDLFCPKKDIQDPNAQSGLAGLQNLGNTCFMNAGLQCLLSNRQLIKFFLEDFDLEDRCGVEMVQSSPAGSFAFMVRKLWCGQFSVLHPSDFKQILGLYHPQFKDYRQHDCQEFLALLLDSLHEQLNIGVSCSKLQDLDSDSDSFSDAKEDLKIVGDQSSNVLENHDLLVGQSDALLQGSSCGQSQNFCDDITLDTETDASYLSSQSALIAEESNQSELSNSTPTDILSHRHEPIPLSVKPFDSPPKVDSNIEIEGMEFMENQVSTSVTELNPSGSNIDSLYLDKEDLESADTDLKDDIPNEIHSSDITDSAVEEQPVTLNNDPKDGDERRLPSLEDLYMKDTKTLNTNVLATEFMHDEVAMDSEKFHKQDNTERPAEEEFDIDHLNDLLSIDTAKGDGIKPIKETNLLANVKDKFTEDDGFGKKCLFSELEEMGRDGSSSSSGNSYTINNIKRMKMDEEEKNLRMQAKLKVNTDKNPTKEVNIAISPQDVAHCNASVLEDCSRKEATCTTVLDNERALRRRHNRGAYSLQAGSSVHLWAKHLQGADRAWKKYLSHNQSVIVDTFQGQFKSTVVCSECSHVSVTFEPFMYLSVPIPQAMERQISVIFIPCDSKQPLRYLLTLNKQDSVKKLKEQLVNLIGEEDCDMVIAEVFENHIARLLEEHTLLRFVNDTNRTVYAFEMLPPPQIDDVVTQTDDIASISGVTQGNNTGTDDAGMTPNNIASNIPSLPVTQGETNIFQNKLDFSTSEGVFSDLAVHIPDNSALSQETQDRLNNSGDNASQSWSALATESDIKSAIVFQHNLLGDSDESSSLEPPVPSRENDLIDNSNEEIPCSQINRHETDDMATEVGDSPNDMTDVGDDGKGDDTGGPSAADQWKSCAICLEEMVDSDLMVHTSCGGTLCHTCLEMSFKHYGEVSFMCPVCSTHVNPADDFIQLSSMADYKPKTRILSVPVLYRWDYEEDSKQQMKLFGHPNILYLPSNIDGEFLYKSVDRVVPCLACYTVIVTDGQGYRCSRCLYTQHCSGCELPRDGDINLQPGDHLTVAFTDLTADQMANAQNLTHHVSMEAMRSKDPLTLFDCFDAFMESEVLDEHNPWYCPRCKRNQCANKTMTVWRFPETLVVYLKRFVFHEFSSTKIDKRVVFPLENLDVTDFVSGPQGSSLVYDLQSCVCHFGGVNSGHYTSYAKHTSSGEWHYFNDETITKEGPNEQDYSNAYILFYQRQGYNADFKLPEKFNLAENPHMFDDQSETLTLTSGFPAMDSAPYPSPVLPDTNLGSTFDDRKKSDSNKTATDNTPDTNPYDFYS